MSIFEFDHYKEFVLAEIAKRPKKGRGEFSKIATAINVHTTMITHIFRGSHDLSPEQALSLADYLGLRALETDYFISLVNLARAGDSRSRKYFKNKLREIKEKSLALTSRLEIKNQLSESEQALFYSSWIYAAIRLLTATPTHQDAPAIAESLHLSLNQVSRALERLTRQGLVKKDGDRFLYANLSTYVERDSELASRHNLNWRLKAIERLDQISATEMAYSNPIMIAKNDFERVTELVVKFIDDFRKLTGPSPSEILCCLNIDWLKITR